VLAAGMNDHISKPIDVDEMFKVLARWIKPRVGQSQPAVVAAESTTAAPAPLAKLPGIDVEAGLRRTQQNHALYGRMLDKFASGHADFEAAFRAALDRDELALATRMAHTLRGTAGTIGANAVWQAATELELACDQGRPKAHLMNQLVAVGRELTPVLAGLRQRAGGAAPSTKRAPAARPDATAAKAELAQLARKLRDLLVASDPDALSLAAELRRVAQASPVQVEVEDIAQAVDDFRFDDALEALDRWRSAGSS